MKLEKPIQLSDLSSLIAKPYKGDGNALVTGINEIHKVQTGDLTFVDHPKYYSKALDSAATFIIINQEVACPPGKGLIVSEQPFDDYNFLTKHFSPYQKINNETHAQIGKDCIIEPGVVIGDHVTIGDRCILHANVVIRDHTIVGNDVIIQSNTVVGSDAFYYKKRPDGSYTQMHSCGRVIIEDHAEIGAHCTIDRGVSGDTVIGSGTKIDNLVHIAHGVVIGKHCLIAAQVGIAGKTRIGDRVTIWGQVGINKDLDIGDGAVILAQSGVGKDIEAGKSVFGSPAQDARTEMKERAWAKQIPELWKRLVQN